MRYFYQSIAAIILYTLFAVNGFAVEQAAQSPEKQAPMQKGMGKGKGMGPMGGMSPEQKDKRIRTMQEEMLKMHELTHQILAAKDPKERERLKEEHLALMKAHREKMMARHGMMRQHRQNMKQGKPADKAE